MRISKYVMLAVCMMFLACISHGSYMEVMTPEERRVCANIVDMRYYLDHLTDTLVEMEGEFKVKNPTVAKYIRKEAIYFLKMDARLKRIEFQVCKPT